MRADGLGQWLSYGGHAQPFADLTIRDPSETTHRPGLQVAQVVEVQCLLPALDGQAFKDVERPGREREAPHPQDLLVLLCCLLDLVDPLAAQVEPFADLLEGVAFGSELHHLGHHVGQLHCGLAGLHFRMEYLNRSDLPGR